MTTYETSGPFNDQSFKVMATDNGVTRVLCVCKSGSLEQNSKDAELIVEALNNKESK